MEKKGYWVDCLRELAGVGGCWSGLVCVVGVRWLELGGVFVVGEVCGGLCCVGLSI